MDTQKRPEEAMPKHSRQMLDDVFDAITMAAQGSIVSIMHVSGNVTRWSSSAVDLLGLPGEYIENGAFNWSDYVHPEDRRRYLDTMEPLAQGKLHSYDLTYRVRTRSGKYMSFRAVGSVLRDETGNPSLIGGLLINQGITENTDPVTVLRNKNGFMEDLSSLLRDGQNAVVLLCGFSGLTDINRVYGYSYGNRILQQAAWQIQESVRHRGQVYRMDGSTFALLTVSMSEQETAAFYDALRVRLQRGVRVRVNGVRHPLNPYGGLISVSGTRTDAPSVYASLRFACRESRERRRGELVDFSGETNTSLRESLEVINVIREDIINGCKGFALHYQPLIETASEQPVAVEGLLRWSGRPFGNVPPLDFLPVLESDFVFEELGSWILEHVLADGVRLLERNPDALVCVNIAPSQLEDEYFLDSLSHTMKQYGFPADHLCIELTRSCRMMDPERLRMSVEELRQWGILILLDDFGTGNDSLAFLRSIRPDYVKFDLDLVRSIGESETDRWILLHLAQMMTVCQTRLCVKGVETQSIRDALKYFPVHSCQGWLYTQPAPFEEILERFFPVPPAAERSGP